MLTEKNGRSHPGTAVFMGVRQPRRLLYPQADPLIRVSFVTSNVIL
ncbi:MAG: hypothetical protein M5U34_06225 [Chloroflexi bacterium]|nr:hypothetical protein [Chloroflexota bacterium]